MAKHYFKKFRNSLLLIFAPKILYIASSILFFTCRKKFYVDEESDNLPNPVIVVFWHGELLPVMKGYMLYRGNKNIDSMISDSKDGELIAKVVSLFGGGVIRGSSTRGGVKALIRSFKTLSKKRDLGIALDGPKGPRHTVSDGVVLISQKKSVPIVTFNCKPTSYWQLNSWDKFVIPKPFCTLNFYVSEPFLLDDLSMQEAKEKVKERLIKNAI